MVYFKLEATPLRPKYTKQTIQQLPTDHHMFYFKLPLYSQFKLHWTSQLELSLAILNHMSVRAETPSFYFPWFLRYLGSWQSQCCPFNTMIMGYRYDSIISRLVPNDPSPNWKNTTKNDLLASKWILYNTGPQKLFCQTPGLVFRLEVDFVLPLSQEEQQEPSPKFIIIPIHAKLLKGF